MPFETFKALLIEYTGRGSGDKVRLAKKVSKHGFNIENAGSHPECQSARYFLGKIDNLLNKI